MKKKEKKHLKKSIETLYETSFKLSHLIWGIVNTWTSFNKRSLGEAWIKIADSLSTHVVVLKSVKTIEEKDIRMGKIKVQLRKHEDILEKAIHRKLIKEEEYKEIKEKYEGWKDNLQWVKILLRKENQVANLKKSR